MKLNPNIKEYDVRSLDGINSSVKRIQAMCKMLEQLATVMERQIGAAEREFTSINMVNAKSIVQKCIKSLSDAEVEFDELLRSVEQFTEKLRHAWRSW